MLAVLAGLGLASIASSAAGSVTIGQTQDTTTGCGTNFDWVQPTVTSGNGYVVPAEIPTGAITSWSSAANNHGGAMTLKVFRHVTGSTYRVIGHDVPRQMTPSVFNTFSGINIPVQSGDLLGAHSYSGGPACVFDKAGDAGLYDPLQQDLADGEEAAFQPDANTRLNLIAKIEPDADQDGFGDETQDQCPTNATTQGPCPVTPAPAALETGQRAAALKKCKQAAKEKGWAKKKLRKCKKKAKLLPV